MHILLILLLTLFNCSVLNNSFCTESLKENLKQEKNENRDEENGNNFLTTENRVITSESENTTTEAQEEKPKIHSNVDCIKISEKVKDRFNLFMRDKGNKIIKFSEEHLPKVDTVFYPFGGGDLIYPLLLFPNAKIFLLVGMEHPGENSCYSEKFLEKQLETYFRAGFFKTIEMSHGMSRDKGIFGLLASEIALLGGKIKEAVIYKRQAVISFEYNGIDRKVIYIRADLSKYVPMIKEFLKKDSSKKICMIKACSYLLHQKAFENIRDFIITNFNHIVQDDTGIPFRLLSDFKVQLFGGYQKGYPKVFQGYTQKFLKEAYEKIGSTELPFCYGYGCGIIKTNMMLIQRK